MELFTSDTAYEYSLSDNSHLFGIPFQIYRGHHASMRIPRQKLGEWIERTRYLEEAGIEFHFIYGEMKL